VRHREGERVRAGEVILQLDDALERLELERRRLAYADHARLEEARAREATLAEQVAQARRLRATDTISRKQLDDEELAWRVAVADVRTLELAKAQQRVELELAEEALARRSLRAPIDGLIASLEVDVGESVQAHDAVVRLVDDTRMRFVGNVSAVTGAGLVEDDEIVVQVGERRRQVRVTFVSPVADPASGLVRVKAMFIDPDETLRPGLMGRFLFGADGAELPIAGAPLELAPMEPSRPSLLDDWDPAAAGSGGGS